MQNVTLEAVQWASLKDIDDVAPISQQDTMVLAEIREVLAKHGCLDRFGISLLHKHFDLLDDEILMETTDVENRVSTTHVERYNGEENTIQTMWKFGDITNATVCVLRCHYFLGHKQRHQREGR